MEIALQLTNLKKQYGLREVVHGISLTVPAGEIFALIGPNGAGKSTTLKMLATLLKPTSGEVNIFDLSVVDHPEKVREIISYLPEEAGAYKNMTGLAYLTFMANLYTANPELAKQFIERGIKLADLGPRIKDKASTYSKGMTRKLLLARTVMCAPKLVILDEPTSGLDIINAMSIRTTIKELAKAGLTVILSSHNMLEIEYLSDRVGLISDGNLHDVGSPKHLKEKYKAENLEQVFMRATGNEPIKEAA